MIKFFLPMIPPTVTDQEKKVAVRGGKPHYYRPPALAAAREKLKAHLAQHRPDMPLEGALSLHVLWAFPCGKTYPDGAYKSTRPDTDNLQKMLKDVMTELRFWGDDAQVAVEVTGKVWSAAPGITVVIERLGDPNA